MATLGIPAPIGGWNARDPLDLMQPTDAIELINLFPTPGAVVGRGGSLTKITIPGSAPVYTLAPFTSATASKFLAATNGKIYDITGFGSSTQLGTGFVSDKWQTGHFNNKLVFVNGQDTPQVYDGTTLGPITASLLGVPVNAAFAITSGSLQPATYYYRVTALLGGGESLPSPETSIVLPTPYATPVNVAFTQGRGSLANATYFYRVSATGPSGETLASTETSLAIAQLATPVITSVTPFLVGGFLVGATYSYRVSAINAAGETLASANVTAIVGAGSTGRCDLLWGAVAGATGYKIYGRFATFELWIATVGAVTTYTDQGTPAPLGALPSANTTSGGVNVNWNPVTNATGYKIYGRSTGAELFIASVGAVTTYLDNGSITPAGALPSANSTSGGVIVNWVSIPGAEGYKVYGRTIGGEQLIATVGVVTTYTDNGSVTPSGAMPTVDTTTKKLYGVMNMKGRAMYWALNTAGFWYAAAGAFQGNLAYFPMDLTMQRGGYTALVISWSRDNGDGVDDMTAIISSNGEAIVYQGTDPGFALNWSMVGRFNIGTPLSVRAHGKVASQEIILSLDGFSSIDDAIKTQETNAAEGISGKIMRATWDAVSNYQNNFGWECLYYPRGSQFIVNIPISATQFEQYVQNTGTGAWCRFTGWNAQTFAVFGGRLYFGGNTGQVVLADTDNNDTVFGWGDNGVAVPRKAQTAFLRLSPPGQHSQMTAVELVTNMNSPTKANVAITQDYSVRSLSQPSNADLFAGFYWDTVLWDTSYWGDTVANTDPISLSAKPARYSVVGYGFAMSVTYQYTFMAQQLTWFSTNLIFNEAGV